MLAVFPAEKKKTSIFMNSVMQRHEHFYHSPAFLLWQWLNNAISRHRIPHFLRWKCIFAEFAFVLRRSLVDSAKSLKICAPTSTKFVNSMHFRFDEKSIFAGNQMNIHLLSTSSFILIIYELQTKGILCLCFRFWKKKTIACRWCEHSALARHRVNETRTSILQENSTA